jgi:hypothetical protein
MDMTLATHALHARPDLDLGRQCAVDGAAVRDLQEFLPLLGRERRTKPDLELDPVNHALLIIAARAVLGVDAALSDMDCYLSDVPVSAAGVKTNGHRRT